MVDPNNSASSYTFDTSTACCPDCGCPGPNCHYEYCPQLRVPESDCPPHYCIPNGGITQRLDDIQATLEGIAAHLEKVVEKL